MTQENISYVIDVDTVDEFGDSIDHYRGPELEFDSIAGAESLFEKIKKDRHYKGDKNISMQLLEIDNSRTDENWNIIDSFDTV